MISCLISRQWVAWMTYHHCHAWPAQKYAPHSFANEQTHVACGNIYGEQHHPFGTGNQASNRPCSNNSTLVACFPHCHFPAEPAIPEASKVQKPVHAVELANELAMVIIGRSVMLRSGLGAGTGGQTSSLGWDKNRRQFRGKAVRKGGVERTSGKNKWKEQLGWK